MPNNPYSIDDILSEYPKKKNERTPAPKGDIDIDTILSDKNPPQYDTAGRMKISESHKASVEELFSDNTYSTGDSAADRNNVKQIKQPKPLHKKIRNYFNGQDYTSQLVIADEQISEQNSNPPENVESHRVHHENNIHNKMPKEDHSEKLSFEDAAFVKPLKKTSNNTEMIDSLTKLKKERVSSKTSAISAIPRKSIQDINLNLDDKILPNTSQIPIDHEAAELEKLRELKERRKKKISDFVLVGEDEEDVPDEEISDEQEERNIDDFESFEDAPAIINDIKQLRASLLLRFIILLITSVVGIYLSLSNDFAWKMPEIFSKTAQPTTYLIINITLGLISAFVSYTVISCGIIKLFTLKADGDSICALAVASSLISACIALANPTFVREGITHLYISTAVISLLFNTIGKILIVGRTERNFKYVSGDFERYAIFSVESEEKAAAFTRGTLSDFPVLSSMKKTEFITDFLKMSYAPDATDKFFKYATPIIAGGAIICAVISGITGHSKFEANVIYTILSSFAGCVALCSCIATILVVSLPMMRTSKKQESSAVMLSYDSVEEFSDTNSVLVDAAQLFPKGMVNLSAIKIFSDTKIDEAIVEAASLTNHSGSILKNMFYDIIVGKTEMLNPVESYIYEDSMGLCGWINNKRILLGNRELMINHSIGGMPTAAREKEYTENGKIAVYLSISGELSAMFVIEVKASLEVKYWLKQLEKNEIYVILRSVDSLVSINKLSELFEISPEMLKIIPFRLHQSFEEETSYSPRQNASMACIGRFSSFASLIIGTKRLRKSANLGLTLQSASAILGFILSIVLTIMSSFGELTGTIVLLYNLAWAAVTIILQSMRKT